MRTNFERLNSLFVFYTYFACANLQILKAWGCRVVACSRREAESLRKAGAEKVIDSSKESFSDLCPDLAAVVDTVGIDNESIAANLMKYKGCKYISTMPASIRLMQQKGLLQGASIFASVFGGRPEVAPTDFHWVPDKKLGHEVISYVLRMAAEAQYLKMWNKKEADMNDYMDAILWPRDTEGTRFGFPAPVEDDSAGDFRVGR